jgi:hypothetical protein
MDLTDIESEGVDWINLAQDRNKWRAVLNIVMNFLLPYSLEVLDQLRNLASQEGVCSMDLMMIIIIIISVLWD